MHSLASNESHATKQVVIIHLSDPHFGPKHRFNPEPTPAGDIPPRRGYPTLLQKLSESLDGPDPQCPVLICMTGDFAETGSSTEFKEAMGFVIGLAGTKIFGKQRGLASTFVVPGNHDVSFTQNSPDLRLAPYAWFLNGLYGAGAAGNDPNTWPLLHDHFDESGVVLLTLNSSMYVQKDMPDQDRGQLDVDQLARVEQSLERMDQKRLHQAIKIALIHHHPVLIPSLAEPGRGYDAVHNSGRLLSILRHFGFHMILHGHKHNPYVFSEDSRSAFRTTLQNPILVAAGGSVGSTAIPLNRWNCYNRISIKWHPAAGQARLLIETIGLSVYDAEGVEALPANWAWKTLRREDIHFLRGECIPHCASGVELITQSTQEWKADDKRPEEYLRLRGNMLSVEVRPSLRPEQGYEAVAWITPHKRRPEDIPLTVEWSAGHKFKHKSLLTPALDDRFCTAFDYWGPMLIQARLEFSDGKVEYGFIYARIPEDCAVS